MFRAKQNDLASSVLPQTDHSAFQPLEKSAIKMDMNNLAHNLGDQDSYLATRFKKAEVKSDKEKYAHAPVVGKNSGQEKLLTSLSSQIGTDFN